MDWLSHNNHAENRDQEIAGMSVNVNVISASVNMLVCTSIEDKQAAACRDEHLQDLKTYIIQGWPYKKEEADHSMRNELAMIEDIVMKGKRIINLFNYRSKYCSGSTAATWE